MNFFNKIKSSIYDPEFYSRVVSGENTHPFKYFFKLIGCLALILAIATSLTGIRNVSNFLKNAGNGILENYPKELEIKIEKGIATTNVEEPYFIKVPENLDEEDARDLENLLVIDTKSQFSVEKYDSYKTLGVLTRDALIVEDGRGKMTIVPLKDIPNYTINYDAVSRWLAKARPFMDKLPYFLPLLVFIGVFIAKIFLLVYLLITALIVWIIGKVKKMDLSYKTSYRLSLHLVTTQLLLGVLAFIFRIPTIAFLPTLIFVVMAIVNLKRKAPEVLVQG